MLEVVKADLEKRLARVPQWYWDRRPTSKDAILAFLESGNLVAAEDCIYFIEYKLDDWATD